MTKSTRLLLLLVLIFLNAGAAFATDRDWRQQALDQTWRAASAALARPKQNLPVSVAAPAPADADRR